MAHLLQDVPVLILKQFQRAGVQYSADSEDNWEGMRPR